MHMYVYVRARVRVDGDGDGDLVIVIVVVVGEATRLCVSFRVAHFLAISTRDFATSARRSPKVTARVPKPRGRREIVATRPGEIDNGVSLVTSRRRSVSPIITGFTRAAKWSRHLPLKIRPRTRDSGKSVAFRIPRVDNS